MRLCTALLVALAAPSSAFAALNLSHPGLTEGSATTVTITGANPGETVVLGYGTGLGSGPCFPLLGGLCADLTGVALIGTTVADGVGTATFSVTPPAGSGGLSAGLQAAVRRGVGGVDSEKSNTWFGTIGMPAGSCLFSAATVGSPLSGSGTCSSPWVIDLGPSGIGGELAVQTGPGGFDENIGFGYGCGGSTARDLVYHVILPPGAVGMEISTDAAAGADPYIGVAEDPSCYQPTNACGESGGAGEAECVSASNPEVFFGTSTYVYISEVVHTGTDFKVSFRSF